MTTPTRRIEFIPAVTSLFLFALAFGLGVWQIDRGAQKREFLERLETRITQTSAPLPGVLFRLAGDRGTLNGQGATELLKEFEYSPIVEKGEILSEPVFFRPAVQGSFRGNEIFAALQLKNGFIIPVNIGFIPGEERPKNILQTLQLTDREIEFKGMFRLPASYPGEPKNGAVVADVPFNAYFKFFKDQTLPAFLTGAKRAFPCPENAKATECPTGRDPKEILENVPNNHLSYTITWWSLAAVVAIGYFWRLRLRERKNNARNND